MSSFVMPEDEWLELVDTVREERRADPALGDELCDCFEESGELSGVNCTDCVGEAAERVPKRYHHSAETAARYEPLPGCWP